MTDQWVKITLVLVIIIYLAAWIIGYAAGNLLMLTSFLNLAMGLAVMGYNIVRKLQFSQQSIEGSEVIFFAFEILVIGCALYCIVTRSNHLLPKVIQYLFYGMHLSALILFLIFMLTFRINKLI